MKLVSFINQFCDGARKLRIRSTGAGLLCLWALFAFNLLSAAAAVRGGVTKTDRTFAAEGSERTEVKEFARAVLDHRTKAHARARPILIGRKREKKLAAAMVLRFIARQ